MQKLFSLIFFYFGVEETSQIQSEKRFTCDINQGKCFTNFLQFLMSQSLSQTKLLKNILSILLTPIPCTSK